MKIAGIIYTELVNLTKRCKIRPIFTPFRQYGLVRIRCQRTGTHHWGNNAWIGAEEFPETNQGEP